MEGSSRQQEPPPLSPPFFHDTSVSLSHHGLLHCYSSWSTSTYTVLWARGSAASFRSIKSSAAAAACPTVIIRAPPSPPKRLQSLLRGPACCCCCCWCSAAAAASRAALSLPCSTATDVAARAIPTLRLLPSTPLDAAETFSRGTICGRISHAPPSTTIVSPVM